MERPWRLRFPIMKPLAATGRNPTHKAAERFSGIKIIGALDVVPAAEPWT
jgi:hypothetical protein